MKSIYKYIATTALITFSIAAFSQNSSALPSIIYVYYALPNLSVIQQQSNNMGVYQNKFVNCSNVNNLNGVSVAWPGSVSTNVVNASVTGINWPSLDWSVSGNFTRGYCVAPMSMATLQNAPINSFDPFTQLVTYQIGGTKIPVSPLIFKFKTTNFSVIQQPICYSNVKYTYASITRYQSTNTIQIQYYQTTPNQSCTP